MGLHVQQRARGPSAAWQPWDPSGPKCACARVKMIGCLYHSPHVIPGVKATVGPKERCLGGQVAPLACHLLAQEGLLFG